MADERRLERFVRTNLQRAGERFEELRRSTDGQLDEAREAYSAAKNTRSLPSDGDGRAKIVCRRYAEQRAVRLDEEFRPACFEADHPDCEGCAEDVRAGRVETW